MSHDHADHHDADLMLRVYEMRREPVMRESRDALGKWFPKKYEDLAALSTFDHPLNRPWRQCVTYWEMVYSMVRHGAVHTEMFLEANGEGLFLFAKIKPFLEQYRKDVNPRALFNTEWVATQNPTGVRMFESIETRVRKMAESMR